MRPKQPDSSPSDDLFRSRLENLIDMRHELVWLSELIDWEVFETEWGELFEPRRGAPGLPTRLIAGLQYPKQMHKRRTNRWCSGGGESVLPVLLWRTVFSSRVADSPDIDDTLAKAHR